MDQDVDYIFFCNKYYHPMKNFQDSNFSSSNINWSINVSIEFQTPLGQRWGRLLRQVRSRIFYLKSVDKLNNIYSFIKGVAFILEFFKDDSGTKSCKFCHLLLLLRVSEANEVPISSLRHQSSLRKSEKIEIHFYDHFRTS